MRSCDSPSATIHSCFFGYIVQAIVNVYVPLLFVTFQNEFGLSLSQVTLLITFNFGVQLLVDLLSVTFVDRIGYRASVVAAHVLAAAGLILLAFLPNIMPPFAGILTSVTVYAVGGGLIEVVVSPIVESCPSKQKEKTMSLLHSFYCWGSVGVILLSTLFFSCFGIGQWKVLACVWALIPLYNIWNFATCPIERLTEEGKGMTIRALCKTPLFWLAIVLMVCAGASELSMAQWASAYTEAALGFTKTLGDLIGPCLFAVTMGISRVIYGRYGAKMDLTRFMIGSGILCLCCYLLASLSKAPVLGLIGCVFCGFSVGIMWPGTISIVSPRLPQGGTALFALLAMAGDLGGAFGPSLVGTVTQQAGDNLQAGMLVGSVFPLVLVLSLVMLNRHEAQRR